jgi:predicted HTH transcriptional regulator
VKIHDPDRLIESLCSLPRETDWVEFKESNFNPDSVGQYASSLANSAMLHDETCGYLVFGIKNDTHEVVGTSVDLAAETVGSERFLFWLQKLLDPQVNIQHHHFTAEGRRVELLAIEPGYSRPVRFKKVAYIRVDSSQQPLSNHPEKERALWQITSRYSFENATIITHASADTINLDFEFSALLKRLQKTRGETLESRLRQLETLNLIADDRQGGYDVSSLFALACAKNLDAYPLLYRKGVRVTTYKTNDKLESAADAEGRRGYTVTFAALMSYIMDRIPSEEQMRHGIRTKVFKIPEASIREFVANAIIHQDFTINGAGPVVEIYADKVRIINPGIPLVDTDRFIDTPSKSRNPRFAKLMRDAGLCEERGSGVDRALIEIEKAALPPPLFQTVEGSTIVTVFMPKRFAEMTPDERIRACFQHACLGYERNDPMSNGSLRGRFGLPQTQYSQVSNVIRDAIDAGRIKPLDADQANRNARYVPWYA